MRLSEAAEKLRQQAGISVQTGREDNARELLYQKKKVLEAMDKSKARIQLLDDLSFKLNEAISAKETHLIDNVASDLDTVKNDTSNTVRIVSPKVEVTNLNVDEILVENTAEFTSDEELQTRGSEPNEFTSANGLMRDLASSVSIESDVSTSSKGVSSFEDFIANIDEQLNRIESELDTVLRVSALVLGGDEKLNNLRVQHLLDILEGIHRIRERISKIMQKMPI